MGYESNSNQTVENIVYDETVLSNEGEIVEIKDVWMPKAKSWSPVYKTLTDPFDITQLTNPRLPVDLGNFDISYIKELPRLLRMTIKPVGSHEISIPKELSPMKTFLEQACSYEKTINEKFEECEIHLTVDYSTIEKDNTQRFPGWHVDGLQGGKFKNKLMAEHSYIIATNNPTEFCLQPFFVEQYDEDITNYFKTFDQQAQNSNIYRGLDNHLYLMDAYIVHRTPKIQETTERGFIRVTVANAPLPIEFNTLNPMLDQVKAPTKLDIRDWLRAPDNPIDYRFYGLEEKVNNDSEDLIMQNQEKVSLEELIEERAEAKQDIGVFDNDPLTVGKTLKIIDKNFPKVDSTSPIYKDMIEDFNSFKYTNPRIPIDLGIANVDKIQECPNVLRMLLKWNDRSEVEVPKEFNPIIPLLERIFTYDKSHNPNFMEQVAHITVDTRVITEGMTHRFPGFHGDDLQGGSFPKKETAAHSYILTTEPGTEFCLQPFFVSHIKDSFENIFNEFDKQAREENLYRSLPGHIYLMDPYCVHRTPMETLPGKRTFFRVTFSTKNMLLPHNTINPMFEDIEEEYDSLEVPHLYETFFTQKSDKKVPYSHYGVEYIGS